MNSRARSSAAEFRHRLEPALGVIPLDLQKVLASLNTPCPKCGHLITPPEIKRITWDEIECPACGEQFDSAVARQARKAQEG